MKIGRFEVHQVGTNIWEVVGNIGKQTRVPARIVANKTILTHLEEGVLEQLINTACLPGVVEAVWVLPDAHIGYGAPIGGVFATDPQKGGVVSPGAIGFDINCGVRLLKLPITASELAPHLPRLLSALFAVAGAGVGARSDLRLDKNEFKAVITQGARWAIEQGWGLAEDLLSCQDGSVSPGADPQAVSSTAFQRGAAQLGTLGSGNHYLEIQKVDRLIEPKIGKKLGLVPQQVTIAIHCGSRGFGHQIASDYLLLFNKIKEKYQIKLPDQQLAAAPANSIEGKQYLAAMKAAINFAFANRQLLTAKVRRVIKRVLGIAPKEVKLIWDISHNTAHLEIHQGRKLLVHRKGATRNFPNQPVIVGGSMETASWLLWGTKKGQMIAFASTCHGAGRVLSRAAAKRQIRGKKLKQQMAQKGILVRATSLAGLAEEAGAAYKDVDRVVAAVVKAGISKPVARFLPLGVIKG